LYFKGKCRSNTCLVLMSTNTLVTKHTHNQRHVINKLKKIYQIIHVIPQGKLYKIPFDHC
jgi:hypothetical protein